MTDLTSIGTLFAFVLVCFGVLVLPKITPTGIKQAFRLPYINGKYAVPILSMVFIYFAKYRIQADLLNIATQNFQEFLFLLFILILVVVSIATFRYKFSIIPIIGALCCLYLMIEIPPVSWIWFFCWMIIGLLLYNFYGRRHSLLSKENPV